jgi:hypothetical protein
MLFLLQKAEIRVSQYFCWMVFLAAGQSSGRRIRATAANSGPVILPRMVQGAIWTFGLFLMRLYFPESLRVIMYSFSSFSLNQTGVGTAAPFFRKLIKQTYFWP